MRVLLILAAVILTAQADPPHVLFFLMDDLGYADVSWNSDEVITPNIEAMANEGVILGTSYTQPVCTPSRGALLTGLYAFHIGLQHNVFFPTTEDCAPQDKKMLSEDLKDLGYATHLVGKWHLGFCDIKCTPTYRGFDTFYGFYNGYISHYTHEIEGGYDWRDQEEADTGNNGTYSTWLLRDRAVDIINAHDASQPMFMLVTWASVHVPLEADQNYLDMYPNEADADRQKYLAMMTATDDAIKEVVDAFKSAGLYDNGVVIFTSDNGGERPGSSNAPFRGIKGTLWEGGMRVATFVNSPLLQKTGYTNDGIFHETDWYPTLMNLAGGSTSGLDGVDQTGMIINGDASARDEIPLQVDIITESSDPPMFGQYALRKGDWKVIVGFPGMFDGWDSDETGIYLIAEKMFPSKRDLSKRGHYSFNMTKVGMAVEAYSDSQLLFNLADDPIEKNDLAASEPDKLQEMLDLLETYVGSVVNVDVKKNEEGSFKNYGGIWSPGWCTVAR